LSKYPQPPPPLSVVEPTNNIFERCVPASEAQKEAIRSGLKSVQASNDIGVAFEVKSGDFDKVWMVAAEIIGQGIDKGDAIGYGLLAANKSSRE